MRIILSFLIVTLLAYILSKKINKYCKEIYIVSLLISGIVLWHTYLSLNGYIITYSPILNILMDAIKSGALGGAIFILVMYMGVFDKSNNFTRRLRKNRGVLSIIGSILLLPHILAYMISYIQNATILTENGFNFVLALVLFVSGLIAFIIMVPLFITSFIKIRKNMDRGKWKKIQANAYIFYAMIFIHVIALYLSKNPSYSRNINLIFYISVFTSYSLFKFIDTNKLYLNV
ncbi:ferric reductase-like transmembrane domain-containing protein [Peptostreptococcus equinus]|uniref:Ferric reductase-like transmembrane domain-containing protein n=1 Tax=Peptostreptococcus equinus TaxID=3003601 RepID=A0ABY7JMB9_9FIRM|nr:ferric reductase-like transmembrane domain-containing protein [Peptostreptococcus sp. CBA3647]WAW14499.1 ferric reductase-like transmembrane domain-containing protein [Peptostreptococcus sp. CBA3647]